ncbi:BED-type domain-containing protein, partial [Haematococcus lacustris]
MELGSPRATQRLQMQTLLRRSSMATAEDVQQIPGVSGPLRKRSRTDQPSISTPVWYHRHFGANGEGCDSDRRKCNFCSFAVKAAPGSNPNHLGAHLLTVTCSYLLSVEALADAANVHTVRQHLEARQGQAGPSLEVDNHGVDRLLLEWLLHDGLPLTIVESGAFLEFVRALKPDWTPPSRYLTGIAIGVFRSGQPHVTPDVSQSQTVVSYT